MKKVAIVIQALPFNTIRNAEALRCAVGLTIEEENKIQVLFMGDGTITAASLDTGLLKSDLATVIEKLPPLMSLNCRSNILKPTRSVIHLICRSA